MLKKNKFYNDGKRDLLYLGDLMFNKKNIPTFLCHISNSNNREYMLFMMIPKQEIYEKKKDEIEILNKLNCINKIYYPFGKSANKFNELKEKYYNALEKSLAEQN